MPIPPLPSDTPETPHTSAGGRQSLLHTLYGLFFQPQVLLALQQDSLWRPLRILATLCLAGGILIGMARFPEVRQTTRDWVLWFGDVTQGIAWDDERLQWNRPESVPFTTRHEGWKVDFRGEDFAWPDDVRTGPEKRGLVFTPESVLAWYKVEDEIKRVTVLEDGQLMKVFGIEKVWPEGLSVQPGEFEEFAAELNRGQFFFLLIRHVAILLGTTFFYTLLFAGIPLLMRRTMIGGQGGVARVFCFYCYAAVPALVVTIVYALVNPPFLRISEVYVIVMAAYLFLVFRSIRALLPPEQPDDKAR